MCLLLGSEIDIAGVVMLGVVLCIVAAHRCAVCGLTDVMK